MGLLALGTPCDWHQTKQYATRIRRQGIQQFINLWRRLEPRTGDQPLWGDEVESLIVLLDHATRQAQLACRQLDILQSLQNASPNLLTDDVRPTFHQEYGRYMIESTPGVPYCSTLKDCLRVESNMRYRRELIQAKLAKDEISITMTSFPRLGAPGVFSIPYHPPCGPVAQSLYLPDQIINQHIRFPTLTCNIRQRRGSKVAIFVPILQDINTTKPFIDPTVVPINNSLTSSNDISTSSIKIPEVPNDHIYLDAMGFGMGCCCLQITFQAASIAQARFLYDALVPVAPIMLALSAGSPIFKGFLSDVDCRWNVISAAVDDRTESERDPRHQSFLPKSRYDSVSLYIADHTFHRAEYDDVNAPVDQTVKKDLMDSGVDSIMAQHIAHLFVRDPLVIFSENLEPKDDTTDHFESLQSTNWQSVRFKPPPSASSGIGWRVEFRTMEVQTTDFENAAYSIFIVLLIRAILTFDVNLYLPISKVDENMQRAQKRDSVRSNQFYFRTRVGPNPEDDISRDRDCEEVNGIETEFEEMTMNEIMHGKKSSQFLGLMTLVLNYVDQIDSDDDHRVKEKIKKYLSFISARARGELMTTATYIRKFVQEHPAYERDSHVNSLINYELVCRLNEIQTGKFQAEELLGSDLLS